ncbi:MAG TPA: TRAP transporter small permease [Limnochordales bacterium]
MAAGRGPQGGLDRAAGLLSALAGLLLVVASAVAFGNVVARKALSRPFAWSDELVAFLLVWVVYLPLLWVERSGGHLRVSVLYDAVGPRGRRWMDLAGDVASLAVLAYVLVAGIRVVQMNLSLRVHSPTLGWPMGVLYGVVPASLALAALARLVALVAGLRPRPGRLPAPSQAEEGVAQRW